MGILMESIIFKIEYIEQFKGDSYDKFERLLLKYYERTFKNE